MIFGAGAMWGSLISIREGEGRSNGPEYLGGVVGSLGGWRERGTQRPILKAKLFQTQTYFCTGNGWGKGRLRKNKL